MFWNKYPYTDFHELNLDWCIHAIKLLQKEWEDFSAGNKITFADPLLHDLTVTYAKNTVVLDADGNAYISLQPVPQGVQLANGDYWLMVFNFETYTEKANKNITVNYFRDITRAPYALSVGDWIVLDDVLYNVTASINADDLFEVGVNIVHFTVEQFLKDFISIINGIVLQYKNDIDASESAYRQQLAQDMTNTTASLQAQLDAAISAVTVDSEVINARIGKDDVTYSTLGDAIREQFEKTWFDGVSVKQTLDITTGGYIDNTNGNLITYTDWKYTDFTDISGATDIIIPVNTVTSAANRIYNAFYDADQTFISGFTANPSGDAVHIPAGAKYIRMSTPTGASLDLYLCKSASLQELSEVLKEEVMKVPDSAYSVKYALTFVAGGLDNNGVENNSQFSRLHTKVAYSMEDLIIKTLKVLTTNGVYYRLYTWDTYPIGNQPADTVGSWILASVTTPVVIPKNKWFKILLAADALTSDITDPYNNYYFESIDIVKDDLLTVDKLNEDVLTYVQSNPTSYPTGIQSEFVPYYPPLNLLHFSDIHNKPELWTRICEYLDAHLNLFHAAIMTGDYVGDNLTQYTDMYDVYTPTRPLYMVVGNHDTFSNADHDPATKAAVYAKLFNHQTGWSATFMPGANSMTYYVDFATQHVRLIVLDNYFDEATQLTWLATTLEDAKSLGYSVITASHQVTAGPDEKVDCSFQTLIPYEEVSPTSVVDTAFDAVIGSFISSGGRHIVHISGHEHQDWFFRTANGVLNLAIECATTYAGWTEGARVPYTKSWDCFNALSVDINTKTIKVVRVGHNVDCFNRPKNTLSYDYQNDKVIMNE